MATTIFKDGVLGIPRSVEHFKDGETIYCYKEHGSHRMYLSRLPLHTYNDSNRVDRSAEMFCRLRVEKNRIKLTEDATKYLFRWVKEPSGKVIVTKGYTYGMEEVLYLRAFEE